MKHPFYLMGLFFLLLGCQQELSFETQTYNQKSALLCNESCPEASLTIPVAKGKAVVADSINKKVFWVLKELIYFGEKPYTSKDYNELLKAFIGSYEKLKTEFPKDEFGWEAKIEGTIKYQSDRILNLEINHYTYTGGAHGYQGLRSLLFDPKTGKSIATKQLFKDEKAFKAFAEKRFRSKYRIPENHAINTTTFMFEGDQFQLPLNIFYSDKGILLYYNRYEIASYADGPQELFIPYEDLKDYLLLK
ncbi:DUF3298 and DUF4163 domain-containing protein [Flavobacterium crassostreae]|uniref:Deacetylase PdaC domain-containing protein n=1 Tax=Flavobacterium crassostreae TaxID=1763534 RepID=A0A1B9E5T8_9FLAO|nr:DUF3298 and DUF4163 domain-containing protein [Flavobacterium crassostreae]OCB77293.1 hypothetical protein LPBF_04680 [Flavobacterium crassostreae]